MARHPFILVIKDLWYFVTSEVRGWFRVSKKVRFLPPRKSATPVLGPAVPPLLPIPQNDTSLLAPRADKESIWTPSIEIDEYEESKLHTLLEIDVDNYDAEIYDMSLEYYESFDPTVMYVVKKETACVVRPYRDFDSVLTRFPYGTAVTVTGYQGNYARVFWSHHEGWIYKDDLTPHKSQVWPHFTDRQIYQADNTAVVKLRLLIGDTFSAGELGLPLQAGEWVAYRLREQNRLIPWLVSHGRVPGDWQILLRGAPGVHMSVLPTADSIMEWRGEDGIGRVAYVERVASDQSVTVSLAGYDEPGYFEERIFLELQWRELRPVFIEIL